MQGQPERRRHARFPFERHLEIWAIDQVDPQVDPMVVRAHDISESGFSFLSETQLPIGQEIVLGLRDVDDLLVKAQVRSVRFDGQHFVVGAERIGTA